VAEAWSEAQASAPAACVSIEAADAPAAAAVVVGVLVRAILAGKTPAGLGPAHDALNPASFLDAFEKRGLRVTTEPPC
jgi:hypothetical protein